ncbi:hypothetical protein [Streptomyces griseomycini]|uniref:Lipoprotein CseA n=1 Tax=Streptomyces griseomycini TaxID=66895 RepID=A0A7W7LZ79_9ACTN|nr:hypothetical protein [Streptomyces griseomycini]MBB4898331.1 hypothetical protein [Streptomyces griseomycini]GGQ36896.1 lipoprotein CseA [Streptomyces griseomycini]GGR57179.1 lipoprotein CseA [Streptomyces griseomycini]
MRGLTGAGHTEIRTTTRAATAATAVLAAAGLFAAGCGTGGTGARDEGPAHADPVASAAAPAPVSRVPATVPDQVDAVRLIKADPAVSAEVKRELKPCVADEYAVDVSYGDLTGGTADDIVVNVLTCGDAVGIGSYVYRGEGGAYTNVFTAEEPPVYAEIDRGDLVVTKQVYDRGDPVSSPSGENVITYRWTAGRFTEEYRTHNDYGQVAGQEPKPAPDG